MYDVLVLNAWLMHGMHLIQAGKGDFEYLEKKAMEWGEPKVPSAKQVFETFVYVTLCLYTSVFIYVHKSTCVYGFVCMHMVSFGLLVYMLQMQMCGFIYLFIYFFGGWGVVWTK